MKPDFVEITIAFGTGGAVEDYAETRHTVRSEIHPSESCRVMKIGGILRDAIIHSGYPRPALALAEAIQEVGFPPDDDVSEVALREFDLIQTATRVVDAWKKFDSERAVGDRRIQEKGPE